MKKKYQMITVYEYLKMLDGDVEYLGSNEMEIRSSVNKYLLAMRRANTNAKILESLLA